ncbi:putative nonribosomal peptide synthase [Thozetella sp. PMI_491]|nr:putative nonribosomal peptide synthase [Thozetella sp. PMI_491]
MATRQDLCTIWTWNSRVPAAVDACVHHIFEATVQKTPDAMAICAWDGDLTYTQLNELSTQLAYELMDLGVGKGTIVPLCFNKSVWVPVSKLAVMKAGGASVTLDPSQPHERLRTIIEEVGANLILSGSSTSSIATSISGKTVVVVCRENLSRTVSDSVDSGGKRGLPVVEPSDLLYLVFTSGSTGKPKGAMITHRNFATATKYHPQALGFNAASRVADFASYAFDVSWANFLNTVTVGGCLVIPSEDDRKHDFVGFMSRQNVNYVDLTPSVAALLDLTLVPQLETVVVGGELVELDKLQHLNNLESLIITYGPAECTVTATAVDVRRHDVPSNSIGWPCGATTWIIDPEKNVLAPIGSIGELVLEGPLNGLGYLNDPLKTAASFIEDPDWLIQGAPGVPGRHGKLYRTGDLVRYHPDGSIIFIGRRDNQVKIRGQRVDLSEIEHHIRHLMPRELPIQIVVESVQLRAKNKVLMAFFAISGVSNLDAMREQFAPILARLELDLAKQLPTYMLPSAFVAVESIPMSATGKTDRRALRDYGSSLDGREVFTLSHARTRAYAEPSTPTEKEVQRLWSYILGIELSHISANDSFLGLGGDSIAAMRLASAARQCGLAIDVAQVMKPGSLSDLAKLVRRGTHERQEELPRPFSLLEAATNSETVSQEAAEHCSVELDEIEDIFPCTSLQEGLIALTAKRAGDYVQRTILELKQNIETDCFKAAWEELSVLAPILRTRIVGIEGQGLVQVVLRQPILWKHAHSIETYQQDEKEDEQALRSMSLGTPLTTFGLIADAETDRRYFAWTQHHATYDGWSLKLLYDAFEQAYQKQQIDRLVPFHPFIRFARRQSKERQANFWEEQLSGLDVPEFPMIPPNYQPRPDNSVEHGIAGLSWPATSVTTSSVLRATWATLLSWYAASPDVVFGAVVLGRQASLSQIERVVGPTFATVPIRILVNEDLVVDDFLQRVQGQATDMIEFEQTGLQNIARISEDAGRGCQFQTLLIVQTAETSDETPMQSSVFKICSSEDGSATENNRGLGGAELDAFSTYAVTLTCEVGKNSIRLRSSFDSQVISPIEVRRLLQQFEHILRQFCQQYQSIRLGDLTRASSHDLNTIWAWNATVPQSVGMCVHDLFAKQAKETPNAQAVYAWDGELSYSQLDELSSRLAHWLIGAGLGPGMIVPLYFEKSMWVPVSVLAVLKAGAACVALDATLPINRLQGIVQQVSPIVVLNSRACENLAPMVASVATFTVDASSLDMLVGQGREEPFPSIDPSSPLYVVFTSGSTGLPKGAIITHQNFCSAIEYHQEPLGFDPSSRVFDFTSYAFDVAWSNILHTLTAGACLCIPSEEDRVTDVAGTISRLGVNFIHITPTVSRMLDPRALSSVKRILFIGEALRKDDVTRWRDTNVKLYNTYGPAECTVTSTVEAVSQHGEEDPSIGTGIGSVAWVVQPNTKGLAAIGTIGELWLEGPIVGAGYLDSPEKTSAAFIEDPEWLSDGAPSVLGRRGRLYRTGDMVRYQPDGSILFVGRKDTQVKIRGQRVELGEIEYHIRRLLPPEVEQVVAAVITPEVTGIPTLAVFLVLPRVETSSQLQREVDPMLTALKEGLVKQVPPYLIPGAYIPLLKLPMTATGKTDRRALDQLGKAYTPKSLADLSDQESSLTALSREEECLRGIWAGVLSISPSLVGPLHSFSSLGGDSIKIMSLAMTIRKRLGVKIPVPKLLGSQHTLRDMARLINSMQQGREVPSPPSIDLRTELADLTAKLRLPLLLPLAESRTTVFLTGSTGFLGTQILRHLLKSRLFDRIVLLIRKVDGCKGLDRVRLRLEHVGWWRKTFASMIEVWEGDLSADRLGLSNSQWGSICGVQTSSGLVHAIIHNGATVHWSTNYDKLKDVNVGSTLQLLRAAMHSQALKRFVYISGGLSSGDWAKPSAHSASQATGYDQSKYICERLVMAAATEMSTKDIFSIVKPGLIIGDAESGAANPDDFLWRIVATAIRIHARPTEAPESWLYVSDTATISKIILHHATAANVPQFIELDQGMWVDSFWAAIQSELQQPLEAVSWDAWIELVQQSLEEEREEHILWPVQQFLGALGSELSTPSDRFFEDGSHMERIVRRNIHYLRERGLAGAFGTGCHKPASKVTIRSRRQAMNGNW